MRTLAGLTKFVLFVFHTFFCSLVHLLVSGFIRLFKGNQVKWNRNLVRFWAFGVTVIFNIKIDKKGSAPVPPFILVSNHLSYIDIIPVFLHTKGTFVAKREVRNWPLIGFMIEMVGIIFVDRRIKKDLLRVNDELKPACNEHQGIVFFPEGTTSAGEKVLHFKPSLLEMAATEGMEVSYASIQYRTHPKDEPAVNSVCFFGARDSFPGHLLKMGKNREIYCTIRFGEERIQSNTRKDLAKQLQKRVESIFIPTHIGRK